MARKSSLGAMVETNVEGLKFHGIVSLPEIMKGLILIKEGHSIEEAVRIIISNR